VELTLALVQQALSDDDLARRVLVGALTPVIHMQVARALSWAERRADRAPAHEVADIVQLVLLALFKDGGRALRSWDPEQLPLKQYVAIKAELEVVSMLRSPRAEAPTADAAPGDAAEGSSRTQDDESRGIRDAPADDERAKARRGRDS
jgi:hypothetical protein